MRTAEQFRDAVMACRLPGDRGWDIGALTKIYRLELAERAVRQASQPCGAAGDVTRQLTDLIRDMKLEHRQSAEIADAVLALLRSQPAQGWSIPLGTPIKYRVGGKYPEWERGGPYYFAGISTSYRAGRVGQAILWVADEWPIQHGGNITDDFDPDEWEVAPPQPGKGEGNG